MPVTISVVIPAYNEERYIAGCLECLLAQTRPPDEIIVVDNNSRDRTASIASRYPVRLITEKEQGMIPARNRGFRDATGSIIARTDADSLPSPSWIASIAGHFADATVDALSGPLHYYDLTGNQQGVFLCNALQIILQKYNGTVLMAGPNYALRKALWNRIQEHACPHDHLVHEDIDLAMRIHHAGGCTVWDRNLVMPTSGRRIKNKPLSFFGEYPVRFAKTLVVNSNIPKNLKITADKIRGPMKKIAKRRKR